MWNVDLTINIYSASLHALQNITFFTILHVSAKGYVNRQRYCFCGSKVFTTGPHIVKKMMDISLKDKNIPDKTITLCQGEQLLGLM